jgi:hypothetical protein
VWCSDAQRSGPRPNQVPCTTHRNTRGHTTGHNATHASNRASTSPASISMLWLHRDEWHGPHLAPAPDPPLMWPRLCLCLDRGCHAISMHLPQMVMDMLSTSPDTTLGWPSSRYWRARTLLPALIRAVDVRDRQVAAAHVVVDRSSTMHACGLYSSLACTQIPTPHRSLAACAHAPRTSS